MCQGSWGLIPFDLRHLTNSSQEEMNVSVLGGVLSAIQVHSTLVTQNLYSFAHQPQLRQN